MIYCRTFDLNHALNWNAGR